MLRLDHVIKAWKESGSLNSQINLYGFWNEQAFLTKSGDLGIVLRVRGVDYESLDQAAQEYAVKRLEAALKTFGVGFHVYQYLFKTNRPDIPFEDYEDPVIQAAVDQRKEFFREKIDRLYDIEIFYAIVFEGTRSKTGVTAALSRLVHDPKGGLQELKTQFSNDKLKVLLRGQIEGDLLKLEQSVQSFVRQLSDFVQIDILSQKECFRFLRRLLNYDDWRVDGHPRGGQFLDYQVANSDVEAERDHLRVGDHYVRVLTIKEAISETKPLLLKQLLEIQANFYVATEWVPIDNAVARKEITKRKRHFNVSKSSFISSVHSDAATVNPRDVLIDESKQADIENLGDCLRVLGDGQTIGDFSLTIILYAEDKRTLERVLPDVVRIFTSADGSLFSETYNQLNAYFAIVPGNYRHNLRKLFLLNSNYADISFLFTVHPGETWNGHLDREYLAVLETDNATPYYLNLHEREVAHTLILGATGSGKTMKLEEVNKRTKEAVDFLVAALESGHSEVLTAYLGAIAKFHTYSFGNVMLIARQKPDATNVAGLRTWNSLGRFVKRGEKGIFILGPMIGKKRNENEATPEDDKKSNGESRLYGFRAVYVFDVSQTEGKDLPALTEVNGDVGGYRERLFKFVESQSVELSFSETIAPAKGLSHGGKITLLSGMQPAEEFSTLVHEIAHEMLHRGERRTMTTKQVRETEAEAVAFVVCQSVGLQNGTASQDYIQLWRGDANLLRESLETVQQTATGILGALSPEDTASKAGIPGALRSLDAGVRSTLKMSNQYEAWITDVQQALSSINMSMDDWQSRWPFDFQAEYKAGTNADDAAMKANRFWWHEQNKSLKQDCRSTPNCWLPRGHQGACQPVSPDSRLASSYERGDYVKVEFPDETTGIGEWMWVRVTRCDEQKKLVFGILDNEPLNNYQGKVVLGAELAISYSQIREHRKPTEFTMQ